MRTFFSFLLLVFSFFSCPIAFAQEEGGEGYDLKQSLQWLSGEKTIYPKHLAGVETELQGDASDVTSFLQRFINALAGVATAIAILFLIQNAFTLITAAGGEAVSNAKKGIMWSLIGLIVIIGSFVVVKTVISLLYSGEVLSEEEKTAIVEVGNLFLTADDGTYLYYTDAGNNWFINDQHYELCRVFRPTELSEPAIYHFAEKCTEEQKKPYGTGDLIYFVKQK
ncbi:pilin [Candidatus Gracilibacteria bacterium]|nr:pilin [Candidatus Gracilibacteria bacterium]MCF7819285.1 pilin [Candidatus Gracilibacteria bacterium]